MRKIVKKNKQQQPNWLHYRPLVDSISILNGSFSLNHKRFAYKSKGYQSPAVCLMALLFSKLEPIAVWTSDTINTILTNGDSLYLKVLLKSASLKMTSLSLCDIIEHPIYLGEYKFAVDPQLSVTQDVLDSADILLLKLSEQKLSSLIIAIKRHHFAIICNKDYYCLFDPSDRDQNGNPCKIGCGTACILRFATLNILCKHFCSYLRIDHPAFKIFPIRITRVSKIAPNNEEVPVDIFNKVQKSKKKLRNQDKSSDSSLSTVETVLKPVDNEPLSNNPNPIFDFKFCALVHDTKPVLKKNDYFQNCTHSGISYRILRANGFNQTSSEISALVMLRCHNIQLWNSFVLDNILNMKIANLNNPVQCENEQYLIELQSVTVVGRLRSKDSVILNLPDGLMNFFTKHDMGILDGPISVAIWIEGSKYFMWDNNDRDDKGIKCVYDETKEMFCTACVTEFATLNDLVALYSLNIDDSNRNDFFMIKPVIIHDYSFVPESWNNFIGLKDKPVWIVRGNHQTNINSIHCMERAALIALTSLKYDQNVSSWDSKTVDFIVSESINICSNDEPLTDNIVFKYKDKEVHADLEHNVLSGSTLMDDNVTGDLNLEEVLDKFFTICDIGILQANTLCFGIWKLDDFYFSCNPFECNENGILSNVGTACILRSANASKLAKILVSSFRPKDTNFTVNAIRIHFWDIDENDGAVLPICPNFKQLKFDNELYQRGFGILMANHCESAEDRYSWRAGLQSIQNCYLALAMSQIYDSLHWNENVLDEILKLGDQLYVFSLQDDRIRNSDFKIEFKIGSNQFGLNPQLSNQLNGTFTKQIDQTLSNICEDVLDEEEGQDEQPDDRNEQSEILNEMYIDNSVPNISGDDSSVEDVEQQPVEVGDANDISQTTYDLESALQTLLIKKTHIILESESMKIAIWSENKLMYLFNPKCCDMLGYQTLQGNDGKACLLMFANINRLIQYMKNVADNNAKEVFKLYPVDIQTNLVSTTDNRESWYHFKFIQSEDNDIIWILRGSINERDEIFQKQNRGKQAFFNCLISLCFCSFCQVSDFLPATIDLILFYGDRLYTIKENMKERGQVKICNNQQFIDQVIKSFTLKNLRIHCVLLNHIITGDIKSGDDNSEILNMKAGLMKFFAEQKAPQLAIVKIKEEYFSVWKSPIQNDDKTTDYYYLFDGEACGPDGRRAAYGKASITRHANLDTLVKLVERNIGTEGTNQFFISLLQIKFEDDGKLFGQGLPDLSIPEIVALKEQHIRDIFILQGALSQDNAIFDKVEHTVCAANCISALSMHHFQKTSTWTERVVDDILIFADNYLYEMSKEQFDKGFDPKFFKIGLNQLIGQFEFKSHLVQFQLKNEFKIVGFWRKTIKPILYSLEQFFSKNFKYGAFKCSLLLAIWKEELYYVFDPHSEHKVNEKLQNVVMQGNACLYGFKTIKSLAEFLLTTIPDSVESGREFEILPISFEITYDHQGHRDDTRQLEDHEMCNYKPIDSDKDIYILQGTFSIYDDKYEPNLRGCQIYPVSVIGCVISILRNPRTWTSSIIDDILDIGMSLYKLSLDHLKPDDLHIGFENIIRSLKTCNKINELVQGIDHIRENTVIEIFKARVQDDLNVDDFVAYLTEWFKTETHAIVEKKIRLILKDDLRVTEASMNAESEADYEKVFCATIIWCSNNYFLLDPYDRDSSGNAIERGQGCVLRSKNLTRLVTKFFSNASHNIDNDSFQQISSYMFLKSKRKLQKPLEEKTMIIDSNSDCHLIGLQRNLDYALCLQIMLKFLVTFGLGVYSGIYITQNYDVPEVGAPVEVIQMIKEKIDELTETYRKK